MGKGCWGKNLCTVWGRVCGITSPGGVIWWNMPQRYALVRRRRQRSPAPCPRHVQQRKASSRRRSHSWARTPVPRAGPAPSLDPRGFKRAVAAGWALEPRAAAELSVHCSLRGRAATGSAVALANQRGGARRCRPAIISLTSADEFLVAQPCEKKAPAMCAL